MSEKKPTPTIVEPGSHECPVCGKRSYSRTGVHPQCAMVQADAPRKLRLAAEKAAKAKKEKSAPPKVTINSWQKTCPKCKARVAAQRQTCECGHSFGG